MQRARVQDGPGGASVPRLQPDLQVSSSDPGFKSWKELVILFNLFIKKFFVIALTNTGSKLLHCIIRIVKKCHLGVELFKIIY